MNKIAQYGSFWLYESDEHNKDYILTDELETVYFGFTEEEAGDIEMLLEEI